MKKLILATVVALFAINSVAFADIIDDNLAKAEKSFATATKRLEAAKSCAADRVVCKATLLAKAEKSVANAQKKLALVTAQ